MEKEINITEILKDKPKGVSLYSSVFGGCVYRDNCDNCIEVVTDNCYYFNEKGHYVTNGVKSENGECLLFPSNKMRDWSKFAWKRGDVLVSNDGCVEVIFDKWYDDTYTSFYVKHYLNSENENNIIYFEAFVCTTDRYSIEKGDAAQTYINTIEERLGGKLNMGTLKIEKSQPEFKDGDIVYSEEDEEHYPSISILNLNNKDGKCYYLWYPIKRREVIVYNVPLLDDDVNRFRYATDEEKQRLFDVLAKNGKAWDAEKKQIVDLKPKVEFKQFQKVLTRDDNTQKWEAELFGFKNDDDNGFYHCVGGIWKYCIPYEGNEHLLGTTKDMEE